MCERLDDGGRLEPLFPDGGSKQHVLKTQHTVNLPRGDGCRRQPQSPASGSKLHPLSFNLFTKPTMAETLALAYEEIYFGVNSGAAQASSCSMPCLPWARLQARGPSAVSLIAL